MTYQIQVSHLNCKPKSPQLSYDLTGRYNQGHEMVMSRGSIRNKYGTRVLSKGSIIPSTLYSPQRKAPSRRDSHRLHVALSKFGMI